MSDEPIHASRYAWPEVEIDPVTRMRALAAGLPHVAVDETLFALPFDRVWSFVADLATNTPRFEGLVADVRPLEQQGERLRLAARNPILGWSEFDVVLRPGWCLMRSRLGEVGMAARPEGPRATRFLHFEGSPLLGRLARPFFAWNIRQDFRRLHSLLPPDDARGEPGRTDRSS
ncbi:MAG: hypothetical protein H6748_17385 [Spirochaetaceae bacterium]|nr:hypothetical protein [Myxococcales bacterium]MCB9725824.1 hypothetical protein [Spirochaetaceae bacterium]